MVKQSLSTILAIILTFFLLAACGGGSSGGGSALPAQYTAEEEAHYSEAYTKLGVAYYELLVLFNQLAGTHPNNADSYAKWEAALDVAIAAAEEAKDAHGVVAAFPFSSPDGVVLSRSLGDGQVAKLMAADASLDSARKLLQLYDAGNGPERLTLQYISEKTGKSIDFLSALLTTVQSEKDGWAAADDADKYDNAVKSSEFIRDASFTAVSAMATAASGPLVVAGGVTKAAVGASKIKQIYNGAKVVYEVYQVVETVDNVANLSTRLIIGVGTGDIPPKIPTLSETVIKKLGLSEMKSVTTVVTGVKDIVSGSMTERVAAITGLLSETGWFEDNNDDKTLVSNFTTDGELVEISLAAGDIGQYGVYGSDNDYLAGQTGEGSYDLSYLENSELSLLSGDVADEATVDSASIDISFDGEQTTLTIGDLTATIPGRVDLRGEADGVDAEYEHSGVTLDTKKETVTVAADSLSDANTLIAAAKANIPALVVDLATTSGPYDGSYLCAGDAEGACAFTVRGPHIEGWVDFDPEDPEIPRLNYSGLFDQESGEFDVAGSWQHTEGVGGNGTFRIRSSISGNMLPELAFWVWQIYEEGTVEIAHDVIDSIAISKQ